MWPMFETVTSLEDGADTLRRRHYGVIEARDGQFYRVVLRPLPKVASLLELVLWGRPWHGRRLGDRCLLYYNQPWRFPSFLSVTYLLSGRGTKLATVRRVLETLEKIARLKLTDALLCDVASTRISDRILARYGYQPHCPSAWHRHYIRRFYGVYPGTSPLAPREGQEGEVDDGRTMKELALLVAAATRPSRGN
jgi:hypothetical protein